MAHWSDDRIAELTKLWDRGWSASKIAEEMDIGRGAVLAKARRLNLPERAGSEVRDRIERAIDIIVDAPLNEPIPMREAARMAGVAYTVFLGHWSKVCARLGELAGPDGDKLVGRA